MKKQRKESLTWRATKAFKEAVAEVIEDQRKRGKPLAILRDGKPVWVPAEELGALHETPTPYRSKSKSA